MKIDSVDHFLSNFDFERDNIATHISQMIKQNSPELFYETLMKLLKENVESDTIFNLIDFVLYIFQNPNFIPGKQVYILYDMMVSKFELKKLLLYIFKTTRSHHIRVFIINFFFNLEVKDGKEIKRFFDDSERMNIEELIFTDDLLLIQNLIIHKNGTPELKELFKKIIPTSDRYMIWPFIDFFIENIDPTLEDFMNDLEAIDDIVIKDRIEFFKRKKEIYDRMFDENRLQMTEEEQDVIDNNRFDYTTFAMSATSSESGRLKSRLEFDRIVKEMWNKSKL